MEESDFNEIPSQFREQAKFVIDFNRILSELDVDWSLEFNFREIEDWYGDELF